VAAVAAGGKCALAVGLDRLAQHDTSSPYLVATHDFSLLRLHTGLRRDDGATQWFAGLDRELTARLAVMGDYTSGDENYAAAGVNLALTDAVCLFGAAMFPNAGGDTRFTLQVLYTGAYTK
jgi:hypothetical protein